MQKKSGIIKSGLDVIMPLFLLDDLLSVGFEGFSEDVAVLARPRVIYNLIMGEAWNLPK